MAASPVAAVRVDVGPERASCLQQRDLGRITRHVAVGLEPRVVASRRRLGKRRQRWRARAGGRLRSVRLDARCAVRGPRFDRAHPVLGQRAGLVGADHIGGPERLDRAQALDQSATAREQPHGDRERERDHRQQPLGHVAGQQPDREHDAVLDRKPGPEDRDRHERNRHPHRDPSDQPSDATHLPLERAGLLLDTLGQRRDATKLGVHAGREHHRLGLATGARRATEHKVAGDQARNVHVLEFGRSQHRYRLARERREIDLNRAGQQPHVGRDPLALLQQHDISRDQLNRLNHPRRAVAKNGGVLGHVPRQRLDRALGLQLLNERERRVQNDHEHHRDPDGLAADQERQPSRQPQQQRQRMGQLTRKLTRPLHTAATSQRIRAVLNQPAVRLARGQAPRRRVQVTQQKRLRLEHLHPIEGTRRRRRRGHWLQATRPVSRHNRIEPQPWSRRSTDGPARRSMLLAGDQFANACDQLMSERPYRPSNIRRSRGTTNQKAPSRTSMRSPFRPKPVESTQRRARVPTPYCGGARGGSTSARYLRAGSGRFAEPSRCRSCRSGAGPS